MIERSINLKGMIEKCILQFIFSLTCLSIFAYHFLSVCLFIFVKDRIRMVEREEENKWDFFCDTYHYDVICFQNYRFFSLVVVVLFHYVHCYYWTTARLHKQEKSSFGFSDWLKNLHRIPSYKRYMLSIWNTLHFLKSCWKRCHSWRDQP